MTATTEKLSTLSERPNESAYAAARRAAEKERLRRCAARQAAAVSDLAVADLAPPSQVRVADHKVGTLRGHAAHCSHAPGAKASCGTW